METRNKANPCPDKPLLIFGWLAEPARRIIDCRSLTGPFRSSRITMVSGGVHRLYGGFFWAATSLIPILTGGERDIY
jgi:hypothetical protein